MAGRYLNHIPVPLLQLTCSSDIDTLDIRCLPQPDHVLLRQLSVLVLQTCQDLVVPRKNESHDETADSGDAGQADDYAHGWVVVRRRPFEVCERGPDGCSVADGVDECQSSGTLGRWTRD